MKYKQRVALQKFLSARSEREFSADQLVVPEKGLFLNYSDLFLAYSKDLRRLRSNPAANIPFIYLDRSDFNACAFEHDGHRFIAMNWGVVVLLHDLFFRMLASPDVLKHIGNPSSERRHPKHSRLPINAKDLPITPQQPFGFSIDPNDPFRGHYAVYLAQLALDFLFMHEHQHSSGGHLHFENEIPESQISELELDTWTGDLLTRHVLELEADSMAANFIVGASYESSRYARRLPPGIADHLSSKEFCYEARFFAVFSLFLLMEETSKNRRGTHPSPIFRMWLITVIGMATSPMREKTQSDDVNALLSYAMSIFKEVDIAFSAIADRPEPKKFVIERIAPSDMEHKDRLGTHWLKMRPRLLELAKNHGSWCMPTSFIHQFAWG